MFIINPITKEEATGKLKLLYTMIEKSLGFVPPHFELFATIDFEAMQEFFVKNKYMMTHKKIDKNILPFIRLYIARKECRSYCSNLNDKILHSMNVDKNIIDNIVEEIDNIPFDKSQVLLLLKVLKAVYEPENFARDDLEELYAVDFSDKDFFDLLNYASGFMSRSKMIEAYLK